MEPTEDCRMFDQSIDPQFIMEEVTNTYVLDYFGEPTKKWHPEDPSTLRQIGGPVDWGSDFIFTIIGN